MCYFCSVKNLSDIISPIAADLKQFEAFFGQTLKSDTEPMDSIMRYVIDTHGKRLRPILVLLSAKLFGDVNEQTLRAATFVEMVHNATLLHDDVVHMLIREQRMVVLNSMARMTKRVTSI